MANENIDVIRVQGLEADLLGSTLRDGQLGFASDTDRMIYRRLDDSVKKGWSDDSKQCLLAGNQTLTGVKSFAAQTNFSALAYSQARLAVLGLMDFIPSEIDTITDGVTNLDPSVSPLIKITKNDSTPGDNTVGILAGTNYGQILMIICSDQSGIQIDDTVGSSAQIWYDNGATLDLSPRQSATFVWSKGEAGSDEWVYLSTTGTINP